MLDYYPESSMMDYDDIKFPIHVPAFDPTFDPSGSGSVHLPMPRSVKANTHTIILPCN